MFMICTKCLERANGTVTLATVKGIKNHVFADGCQFGGKDTNDG